MDDLALEALHELVEELARVVPALRFSRFRVWGLGLGFGVWGLGFGVWGLGVGCRVWGLLGCDAEVQPQVPAIFHQLDWVERLHL